ncbi:MAG TPA: hypothetical protein PK156_07570 [Polyangium sp.]|nr:hypothetical protein [Polyangium sp.]
MATSKLIADRIAILRTVGTALHVHGPEIVADLEKLLFPNGTPPNLDTQGFLAALENVLIRYRDELVAADAAHVAELADDGGYRAKREASIQELRNYLSSLRDVIVRNYNAEVATAYNLSGPLTEDAQALLNTAQNAARLLRSRPLTEVPRNKSLKLDPILAAEDLEAHSAALQQSLNDVEREKREAQMTLSAKEVQIARWPVVYSGTADATAALFVLGGRPELAEKVRPTARRRAGTPEAEDTSVPIGTDPPAAPVAPNGPDEPKNG